MGPTGNWQGGHHFYNVSTGRVINRRSWTELPMPVHVIDKVNEIGKRSGTRVMEMEDHEMEHDDNEQPQHDDNETDEVINVDDSEPMPIEVNVVEPEVNNIEYDNGHDQHDNQNNDDMNNANEEEQVEAAFPDNEPHYNLRPRKPVNYAGHVHVTIMSEEMNHTIMTQYSLKRGLQLFGSEGTREVLSQLQQMHDKNVIEPVYHSDINKEEKSSALRYLMFLKIKRDGRIKACGCAYGRKQRANCKKYHLPQWPLSQSSSLASLMRMKNRCGHCGCSRCVYAS